MIDKYRDIIDLPHHQSKIYPQMSINDRAAQFSSFQALTGFEDKIKETNRLTDKFVPPSESEMAELDNKLLLLSAKLSLNPVVTITYFVPDKKKDGGAYVSVQGTLKKIDKVNKFLTLDKDFRIKFSTITDIKIKNEEELI